MLEIQLEELLSRHGLSQEDFDKCGITWDELQEIVSHHQGQIQYLKRLGNFIADGLRDLPEVHSVRMRVKNPEHLAAKIIRKRKPDRLISIDNYEEEITDLIDVRVLHLHKEQWRPIHEHIEDTLKPYEKRANIRKGDPEAWRAEYDEAGLDPKEKSEDEGCYRSIHYTIRSQPLSGRSHCIEIQVRTIFEEAWGEIDHTVNYPVRSGDIYLKNNLTMLNRLAGLGDELSSSTFALKQFLEDSRNEIADKNREIESLKRFIAESNTPATFKDELQSRLSQIEENSNALYQASRVHSLGSLLSSFAGNNVVVGGVPGIILSQLNALSSSESEDDPEDPFS